MLETNRYSCIAITVTRGGEMPSVDLKFLSNYTLNNVISFCFSINRSNKGISCHRRFIPLVLMGPVGELH